MAGMDAWMKAGLLLVEQIDKNSSFRDKMAEKYPDISLSLLRRLEQIGRRELHPRLLLMDSAGARKLRSMPYDIQARYVDEPIKMLSLCGDGTTDHLAVSVRNMGGAAAKQVFAEDHIRTLPEQRAYIESARALQPSSKGKTAACSTETPWKAVRNKIHVLQPCTLDKSDLMTMLNAIT